MDNYEKVFESQNIIYIKVSESLINDYLLMMNDINVQKYISKEIRNYTYENELNWVKKKLSNNSLCFSMLEKNTLRFIGNIEIIDINDNIGEMGITITPEMQNKHFGTEAIKAIMDYGYKEYNLNGFELDVFYFNLRAIHCYEKVGFKQVGVGETEDDIHMIINKSV